MNDSTRRGFLGVLAAVPLSVKAAFHDLGWRKSDEVEVEMSSQYEDITVLPNVTGARFFDKDSYMLTIPAEFEANPKWTIMDPKSTYIGTIVGGTFWFPAGTPGFVITSFELVDSRGRVLWGPQSVIYPRLVQSGDRADMTLDLA